MSRLATLRRLTLRAVIACVIPVVLFALYIPIQQRIFRSRAEHLLADMQALRLHQSTWQDAQTLMHRWGAWGHYDGQCTPSACKYTIMLTDLGRGAIETFREGPFAGIVHSSIFLGFNSLFGGGLDPFQVGFVVQDGTIQRCFFDIAIPVPPEHLFFHTEDDFGYSLLLHVQSRSSLKEEIPNAHWVLGREQDI